MQRDAFILERLAYPTEAVDAVLDTDAFNEVDDQFALSYLLRSEEHVRLHAVYAAPFFNERSTGPADGMEKSYREIGKVLDLCGRADMHGAVYRGATGYLPDGETPVGSPAVEDLIARGMAQPEDRPLYVIGIACLTNIASALLLEPRLRDKIVVVWLGGHAHHWPQAEEFNLRQDVAAAQVVFDCGVPLVQVPCFGVATHLTVSPAELRERMVGKNALCDYLAGMVLEDGRRQGQRAWTRVLWDVAAAAWVVRRSLTEDLTVPAPVPMTGGLYARPAGRHPIRCVHYVSRDGILTDMFTKLAR